MFNYTSDRTKKVWSSSGFNTGASFIQHLHADDTEIYITRSPGDYNPLQTRIKRLEQINNWMIQTLFQLNKRENRSHRLWSQRRTIKNLCSSLFFNVKKHKIKTEIWVLL